MTNNFSFDVQIILGPESTHSDVGTKSRDELTNERTEKVICRGGAPSKNGVFFGISLLVYSEFSLQVFRGLYFLNKFVSNFETPLV